MLKTQLTQGSHSAPIILRCWYNLLADRYTVVKESPGWVFSWNHSATLLPDGTVLLAGGYGSPEIGSGLTPMPYAEIYTPPASLTAPVVTDIRFDRTNVSAGNSFTANCAGSNLTSQMFFDVRFTAPGSNLSKVSLNWQAGLTSAHSIAPSVAPGVWTINGVRPHRFERDHTGNFFPVTATITVIP